MVQSIFFSGNVLLV